MSGEDETAHKRLQVIAKCLNLPIEQFLIGTAPDSLEDATECLTLWYRFKTDAGRASALDALRKALDDEGG